MRRQNLQIRRVILFVHMAVQVIAMRVIVTMPMMGMVVVMVMVVVPFGAVVMWHWTTSCR
ncbi:hypothetical protein GCM10022404_27990 [Celeribacter arenosi]|uniref:Uncharacterized protein n=1 Tax=Celeribacter arenosi TaxID=792649 RepID=A0ABP7KIH4_9RHOB